MKSIEISDETMEKLESLAKKNNMKVNEYLDYLIDDEETRNDPKYIEYLNGIEEALKQYDNGECEKMTIQEFMDSL